MMRDGSYIHRPAIWLALLLTPDDRPLTRRAVMRAALWHEQRGLAAALPPALRKRLLRGMSRWQRTWVSVGVAFYRLARLRPMVPLLFVGMVLLTLISLVMRLV